VDESKKKKNLNSPVRKKGLAVFTVLIMVFSASLTALPAVAGVIAQGSIAGEQAPGPSDMSQESTTSDASTTTPTAFPYPAGSTAVSMPGTQSPLEIRQAYKYMFNRIYEEGDVEWTAGAFSVDGSPYSAGSFVSMSTLQGEFNYTTAVNPFSVTQGYSLHPAKIALFSANTTDTFGQILTWEEGYFERIFKTYLWGNYFDTVTESDIAGGALSGYDVLIIPSITVGYITALETALGPTGLSNIASFVNGGGMLYAQGDSCHIAEAASLVPFGTVLTNQRVGATSNTATSTPSITTSPLTWSWQTNNLYVLDDPLLFSSTPTNVIATYTAGLTNGSQLNSPSLLHFTPGTGNVILTNAHPSDKGAQYPVFMNSMFLAMADRCDIRGNIQQQYSTAVAPDIIPAQEVNVSAIVTTKFFNFWNANANSVMLVEVVSRLFHVNTSSITPTPSLVQATGTATTITPEHSYLLLRGPHI